MKFWQDMLMFLPIIYAAIYLIGLLYHIGYLGEFRLGPEEFPLSTDLILLQGVISLITMSSPHVFYAILLFAAFLALLVFLLFARRTREKLTIFFNHLKSVNRASRELKETMSSAKVTTQLMEKSAEIYARFVVLFVPLLMLIFMGVVSMQNGIAATKKDKENLFLTTPDRTESTSPLLKNGPYLRVACNSVHCAYWNKQGTIILRHDQVEQTYLPSQRKQEKS
ncbi:hypothetical protein [Aeromonas sp. sif2416]|uniref:hypothetical protein n=1 Tax=Aeromonas sp. sif2416 TaxID=2854793 RepID=UPI001C459313|nr:hypothetical protein [Aeromonas sp. sif2416]MBV7437573.1 hypothetical protein [Aeromonas sp. sif2416]